MTTGAVSPPGSCVWTFDGANWTVTQSNCAAGYVCARAASAGTPAITKGQSVPDAKFRAELNAARLKATGISTDVIPKNLKLTSGETYTMDCVS